MAIALLPVLTEADKRAFYKFAFRVYRHDPCWVPHLWPARKAYLDKKAAFYTYGEGEFYLAREGKEIVGTIGVGVNHSRNRALGIRGAIFGFFETLPGRYDVAAAMWDFAGAWARARGLNRLDGPYSFSGEDDHGFLAWGAENEPSLMMAHTRPEYCQFAERYGFRKLHETVAYRIDLGPGGFTEQNLPPVLLRIAERARARHPDAVIRNPRLEDWDREIERLHAVYNRSLAVLPEFYPTELAEFRAQAEGLRDILDPGLVFIAELNGQTVGFALGLPNLAEALRHANGLQHPWDYLRLARAMKRIRSGSFKILAMDPACWGYGLDAILYLEMARAMLRRGYTWVDASLTGENNPQTNRMLPRVGAYIYRRYREYTLGL